MLRQIAMLAEEIEVEAGHHLWSEGGEAKALFLIQDGSVVLTINMGEAGDQNVQEMEPIGKGELVGWSSIVKPHIYKMSAYTCQKSRLILFDGEKLRLLFDERPAFGYYFLQKLTQTIGERYIGKCVQLMSMVD